MEAADALKVENAVGVAVIARAFGEADDLHSQFAASRGRRSAEHY
jgi:hypothetical protein